MPYLIISLFIALSALIHPVGAEAVELHYSSSKTYGTIGQKAGIEVSPSMNDSSARTFAAAFSSMGIYVKVANPPASFTASSAFPVMDSVAGGWYVSLRAGAQSLSLLSSLTASTSKPVVVEVAPYDSSFIADIRKRFPTVKIHTAGYLYWPRGEVRSVLSQIKPPVIEAISMQVENDLNGDIFPKVKLMFDTFFDASGDIPGTSGIKINYPSGTSLALSDIRPKSSEDNTKTAYRMSVAAAAAVAGVQFQGKNNNAPYRYVVMGSYGELSPTARTIVSRYTKFLSLSPDVIWPMAIGGNGDPYDNPFLEDSNSKPVMGVIGVIQGKTEGVIINASSHNTQVELPYAVSANAFSSHIGSFIMSSTIQLSPHETVIFGEQISRTYPAPDIPRQTPSVAPRQEPTRIIPPPTGPVRLPSIIQPAATGMPVQVNIPTPVPFRISTPVPPPLPQNSDPAASGTFKHLARLAVVKADPALKVPVVVFYAIRGADIKLEETIWTFIRKLFDKKNPSGKNMGGVREGKTK